MVAARHARLHEPHVAPLNDLAARIAADNEERVPYFDPASGGTSARVLVLLQDPSEAAAHGSQLISRHNNDPTAANTLAACEQTGLDYDLTVHWNVIPWWAHDPEKNDPRTGKRRSLPGEARRAATYLDRTLDLLPHLDTVVLVGKQAQNAWSRASRGTSIGAELRVLRCPHTSPLAWNKVDVRSGRSNRTITIETFAAAAQG